MKEYKKISILHISDLHKNEGDDFRDLYQTMVEDCDRYIKMGVTKPNIIVVSGDLIRGGNPDEIKKQYEEAKDFLEDLTTFFLDKDKRRIIIVPGNHDVDWNISKSVIKPVLHETEEEKEDYNKKLSLFLKEKAPRHKWNWDDQTLYSYDKKDDSQYNTRFANFANFYKMFYGDREYSLEPDDQFDIFDIPDYNICFVGLNSCYQNDHLNKVGQIFPRCVTKVKPLMKKMKEEGRVLVAVWHHNASGRPMVNNYLDNRILTPIIDMGVHIALHGHQHFSDVVEEYHNAFNNGKLLLFSTGSLYGASEILSYGASRQYSILELEKDNDKLKLTVHLREDNNKEEFGIPTWGNGTIKEIGTSSWSTSLPYPKQPFDEDKLSELVSRGMATGDYREAINMLMPVAESDEMKRKIMLDLMKKGKQFTKIIDYIGNPTNDYDARMVVVSAYELNDREISQRIKELEGVKNSTDPHVKKMIDYL